MSEYCVEGICRGIIVSTHSLQPIHQMCAGISGVGGYWTHQRRKKVKCHKITSKETQMKFSII